RRAASRIALRARARRGHLFPARGLRADLERAGYRVRAPAHGRARCRSDPDLGLLRRAAAGLDAREILLREAGSDAARGRRTARGRIGSSMHAEETSPRHADENGRRAALMRAAGVASVATALTLIAIKLWAYRESGSIAVLGSLADSLLDLVASLITLLAVRVALTPADHEHRFGHGKSEGVAGLVQSLIITGSALYVGAEAVMRLFAPEPIEAPAAALGALGVSLVLTLALFGLQRYVIAKTGSLAI